MKMTETVIASLALAGMTGAALAASAVVGVRSELADTSRPELRAIAELNDSIQERFKDVESFGIRRIVTPEQTPHRFLPENARELDAVRLLEQARLQVVLYLAGRRVLGPRFDSGPSAHGWGVVKGPVQITAGAGQSNAAPAASDVWEDTRQALLAFAADRSYEVERTIQDWKLIARPIRASDAGCLKCHRERRGVDRPELPALRVGDPLGVVVYAYRPAK